MKIFHYHPHTREYLCPGVADRDPLDEDNWLIPAYATTVAPPAASSGYATIFAHGAWTMIEDHRGENYWTPEGKEVTIEDLGPVPDLLLSENPIPVPSPDAAPQIVPMWAVRVVLNQNNLLDQARAAIEASGDFAIQTVWEYGNFADRNSPAIASLAIALGMTSEEVDEMFSAAAQLRI